MREDGNLDLFSARVLELSRRADRGEIALGDFLTPKEIRAASGILLSEGKRGNFAFIGGYRTAERARLCCLPDYMLYGAESDDDVYLVAVAAAADEISVLRVAGSGYRVLSHRDFMGAVLNLGIKRHVLGDIIVDGDGFGAYIFCDAKIGKFIADSLSRVAVDAVKAEIVSLPEGFAPERKTEPVNDTVASPRADCVVAALVNVPRDRAKSLITSGLVDVNYETLTKPDSEIEAGDIISVRGEGKFRINGFDGMTRRGRLRLAAEKFV